MRVDIERLRRIMEERQILQTELARRAGLSRARIGTLLKGNADAVRPGTERKLCAALGLAEGTLDRDGVASGYLAEVARQHEFLDLSGLGIINRRAPIPMDRGFAALEVRRRANRDGTFPARDRDGALSVKRRKDGISASAAFLAHKRLFLLGDPGSGKTTVLRHAARRSALDRGNDASDPSGRLIPVFVRLSEWAEQLKADDAGDVLDAGLGQMPRIDATAAADWLAREVPDEDLLLLLDGLDEVAEPDLRGLVIERIRSFVAAHPAAHVVISSRLVGFDRPALGAEFEVLDLQPLVGDGVRRFAAEWCALRHGHDSKRTCRECDGALRDLHHAIVEHPQVGSLAGSPMMLTMLVLLHESGAILPQRRADLYQRIAEAFLFSWEEKKRSVRAGGPDRGLKLDDRVVFWLLESLALKMQQADWTLVPRWWLADHVSTFLRDELSEPPDEARAAADALIRGLQHRSGLLVERGPDRFGFSHLAFQEYFAARAVLAADDPIEELRPWFHHPRWREVVRLAAAQFDRRRVAGLLRSILDDPDPTGRVLCRGPLLALSCLVDGAPVHDEAVFRQLDDEMVRIAGTEWTSITADILKLLADLRATRLEDFATRVSEAMLAAAKERLAPEDFMRAFFGSILAKAGDEAQQGQGDDDDDADARGPVFVKTIEIKGHQAVFTFYPEPEPGDRELVRAVVGQLRDASSARLRAGSAHALATVAGTDHKVAQKLMRASRHDSELQVRVAAAESLGAATSFPDVVRELVAGLDATDEAFREACVASFRARAATDDDVRDRLVDVIHSKKPPCVRAGAAYGLSQAVAGSEVVRDTLLGVLDDSEEADEVRAACLRALEGLLPTIPEAMQSVAELLRGSPTSALTLAAAQILAGYAATGKYPWSKLPIEGIEAALVSQERACEHIVDALRGLMDAREVRRLGVPREKRIERALADVCDRVRLAFIFGSAARGEQDADSDIDLMVIGDVSLRELSPGLKRAERELGRQVNAVVYSEEEWRTRCREKDNFVMNVLKGAKVFVIGERNDVAAMAE